jgi:hypothetical protein
LFGKEKALPIVGELCTSLQSNFVENRSEKSKNGRVGGMRKRLKNKDCLFILFGIGKEKELPIVGELCTSLQSNFVENRSEKSKNGRVGGMRK